MPKAIIVTVGGTPAPIIKSICEHKPEFVSFFASQETTDLVTQIKAQVTGAGVIIKSEITVADDVNDLVHCHEKAEEAVRRVIGKGYTKDDIIVDYTGGTKNMSVALSLAAITHGFSFSYVGGRERTKNGVGVVVNGCEEIYTSINPWDFLAVEEKRQIALLFNQYQFKAAKDLTDRLIDKGPKNKGLFKKISFIIDGYYRWDLFRHREAMDCFKRAKAEEIPDYEDNTFNEFARQTINQFVFLEKIISNGQKPSLAHIQDLFSNAERRCKEGKIDDAVLRLYRLVEMMTQERLSNRYGIDASNVQQHQLPDSIREEFSKTYAGKRDGKIKIPLTAAFRLLEELNDDLGRAYKDNESRFLDVQSSRNNSYLAHGFGYSKERTYTDLRNFILQLNVFSTTDIPVFPAMPI